MSRLFKEPEQGKKLISLLILIVVGMAALTLPIVFFVSGRPSDALTVIYFFPSVYFMGIIRATAQLSLIMKIVVRVATLALAVWFVLLFKDALPNNEVTVVLAILGLLLCLVFEFLAPSSVWKKQSSEDSA